MMVRRSSLHRQRLPVKFKIITLVFLVSFVFVSEIFYREFLFQASISIIKTMQDNSPPFLLQMIPYIKFLADTRFFAFLVIIVYNFSNVYKTYLLIMITCICKLTSCLLKLFYSNPRPFYFGVNNINPYSCEEGYGNPSGQCLQSLLFYSTLFTMIIETRNVHKNKALKIVLSVTLSLLLFLIMFIRILSGLDSLNAAIFGIMLGLCLYFTIFEVLEINSNNPQQLSKLVEMKNIYYLSLNLICLIPFLSLAFLKDYENDLQRSWKETIDFKCPKSTQNLRFQYEAFLDMSFFFTNIAAFMSLKLELYYIFNDNIQNWTSFNISQKAEDESLLSNLSVEKDTQWNKTNTVKSLIRLIVVIFLFLILYVPFQFISYDSNFSLVLIFREFLPFFLVFLGFFYYFKIILKKLRLVETSVFVLND